MSHTSKIYVCMYIMYVCMLVPQRKYPINWMPPNVMLMQSTSWEITFNFPLWSARAQL